MPVPKTNTATAARNSRVWADIRNTRSRVVTVDLSRTSRRTEQQWLGSYHWRRADWNISGCRWGRQSDRFRNSRKRFGSRSSGSAGPSAPSTHSVEVDQAQISGFAACAFAVRLHLCDGLLAVLTGESFNGKLRDELLDREIFNPLREAHVLPRKDRQTYNRIRPHSSLAISCRPRRHHCVVSLTRRW